MGLVIPDRITVTRFLWTGVYYSIFSLGNSPRFLWTLPGISQQSVKIRALSEGKRGRNSYSIKKLLSFW